MLHNVVLVKMQYKHHLGGDNLHIIIQCLLSTDNSFYIIILALNIFQIKMYLNIFHHMTSWKNNYLFSWMF